MKGSDTLTIPGNDRGANAIYGAVSLAKRTVLSKAQSYRDVPVRCLYKYRAINHRDLSLLDDSD